MLNPRRLVLYLQFQFASLSCIKHVQSFLFSSSQCFGTSSSYPRPPCSVRFSQGRADLVDDDKNPDNMNDPIVLLSNCDRRDFLGTISSTTSAAVCTSTSLSGSNTAVSAADPSSIEYYNSRILNSESTAKIDFPFHTVRSSKVLRLSNGLTVVLVSDVLVWRASACLAVAGAGQWADPPDLPGAAHLLEHMLLSYPSKSSFRPSRDFEDWLGEGVREGASNGFTAYDKVCYHFSCNPSALAPALERFAGLFRLEDVRQILNDAVTLKREVRRVDSELDFQQDDVQAYYMLKSFVYPEHPYSRFSMGNLKTLEQSPQEMNVSVAKRLLDLFCNRYLPSRSVLVVVAPQELSTLERWVAPFASTLSRPLPSPDNFGSRRRLLVAAGSDSRTPAIQSQTVTNFPGGFLQGNRLKHVVLLHTKSTTSNPPLVEKLTIDWSLHLNYAKNHPGLSGKSVSTTMITATQVAFVMAQILGRKGPGSLYSFLSRRGWIPGGMLSSLPRVSVPLDASGFQIIRLEIPMNYDGFLNRSAIVAAVYDVLSAARGRAVLTVALLAQYATIVKLHAYSLAPRPADAVEMAIDALLYGVDGASGAASGTWYRFPTLPDDRTGLEVLQRVMLSSLEEFSDYENAVIIVTADSNALSRSSHTTSVFDESLPPISSPKWLREPVSGARFCFVDFLPLSSRLEEQVLSKIIDSQELLPPVLNPLVPATIRKPRSNADTDGTLWPLWRPSERIVYPMASEGSTTFRRSSSSVSGESKKLLWRVLIPSPYQIGLPMPRGPPEATCRCAFVFQLLSPRPARASVRQAAQAELWKLSFEDAIADLAELGAPGGLAYDWTFTKFGLRLAFLGISQTLASYVRRFCRRLVEYSNQMLQGPELLPTKLQSMAVASARRLPGMTQRRKRIISNLRSSTAYEAATEGIVFFNSCSGGVAFAQGDLLPQEVDALMDDLREIFGSACDLNNARKSAAAASAIPSIEDLVFKPQWKPRYASPCTLPGMILMSDACGRVPR